MLLHKLRSNRLISYVLVGGTAFVSEYGSFLLLFDILHLQVYVANTASFVVGLAVSFTLNRLWAFKEDSYHKKTHHQIALYLTLAGLNVVLTNVIIGTLNHLGVDPSFGKIFAMACVAAWNYFIFKLVIFKGGSDEPEATATGS